MHRRRIRILIEIALTIALATVLSMFTAWKMPYGGSVSLGMLPLLVLALRRGLGPGLTAGALYGVLDFMVDPYVVHWVQPILDYPVAYLMVGFTGLVRRPLAHALRSEAPLTAAALMTGGVAIGAAGRYVAHLISGAVFFGEYAPEGQPVWIYSALYNLYVPASALACLAAALILVPLLERVVPTGQELDG